MPFVVRVHELNGLRGLHGEARDPKLRPLRPPGGSGGPRNRKPRRRRKQSDGGGGSLGERLFSLDNTCAPCNPTTYAVWLFHPALKKLLLHPRKSPLIDCLAHCQARPRWPERPPQARNRLPAALQRRCDFHRVFGLPFHGHRFTNSNQAGITLFYYSMLVNIKV